MPVEVEVRFMPQGSDPIREVCDAVFDACRQIGDFSCAILPKNIAHALVDLNRAMMTELTGALQCEMEWCDNRVAGGDRLREEWRQKYCRQTPADATTTPAA